MAFKEEMYNNIDMNKWLCVSADVLYLTNYGNTIMAQYIKSIRAGCTRNHIKIQPYDA